MSEFPFSIKKPYLAVNPLSSSLEPSRPMFVSASICLPELTVVSDDELLIVVSKLPTTFVSAKEAPANAKVPAIAVVSNSLFFMIFLSFHDLF